MTEVWARVPLSVLEDPSVDALDIAVYAAIASYASSERTAFPSIESIMDRSHVGRMRAIKAIKNLEAHGHFRVERGRREKNRRKPNIYYFDSPPGVRTSRVRTNGVRTRNSSFDSPPGGLEEDKLSRQTPSAKSKAATAKKSDLSPLLLNAFHEIESRLKSECKSVEVTWDPAREGKALRNLVESYSDRLDRLPAVVDSFLDFRATGDRFWQRQPPTASVLLSLLARVETEAALRNLPTAVSRQYSCPLCGAPAPEGAMTCPSCKKWIDRPILAGEVKA